MDMAADILTYGALQPCGKDDCEGQFHFSKGSYLCERKFCTFLKSILQLNAFFYYCRGFSKWLG